MPESRVIIDTGPLVSLLLREDAYHAWVVEQFKELAPPLLTCEPVLTETFFLLQRLHGGSRRFFDLLKSGLLSVDFNLAAEQEPLAKLVHKYRDLPMSLADACLVRMAEINVDATLFTLDHHFRIYRKHGRQQIPLIFPAA